MEVRVYRKHDSVETSSTRYPVSHKGLPGHTVATESPEVQSDRLSDVFYPRIAETEWNTWRHWLPTILIFERKPWRFPADVLHVLKQLEAPQEVLEEFQWADTLELFDAYEIRTPERRDLRDPLLVGRRGNQRYRIALWGESLRPLDEITRLVQHSLVLRDQAATWRLWGIMGGALGGFIFGLLMGSRPSFEGEPFATGLMFGFLGLLFTTLPLLAKTPENKQQNFLDRYRR